MAELKIIGMDEVWLNVLGAFIGYWAYILITKNQKFNKFFNRVVIS